MASRAIMPSRKKPQRGALIFWSWFNSMGARQDQTDERILNLSRAVQIQRQRLDVLEKVVAALSQIVRKDEPAVRFACLVCGHTFNIHEGEARSLNLLATCPRCGNWALPAGVGKVYTSRQAAAELKCSISRIARVAKKHSLGRGWGGGNGTGNALYFTEDEFRQLRQIPIAGKRVAV